ncbi:MAG: hypothetical protein JWP81_571 [Ferruginibacter sp.]|nr:hypothetical protein [Ferruginibacter sp.]
MNVTTALKYGLIERVGFIYYRNKNKIDNRIISVETIPWAELI